MARLPILHSPPCTHRQAATGETVPCRPEMRCKAVVYGCTLHNKCTLKPNHAGLQDCFECVDVQAPQLTDLPIDGLPAGMVRRALLTLNIGGVLTDHARQSHLCAAARWGCDYHDITSRSLPEDGYPHWEKTTLWKWAEERRYGQVAYVDADCLIRSDCPSLFDLVPRGRIGVVRNDQLPGRHWRPGRANVAYRSLALWAQRLGLTCPDADDMANSGVLVWWTASAGNLFHEWGLAGKNCDWRKFGGFVDQAVLSVLLRQYLYCHVPLWLPPQYNLLVWREDMVRTDGRAPGLITHFAGEAAKRRMTVCQWDLRTRHRVAITPSAASARLPSTAPLLGPDVDPREQIDSVYVLGLERRRDRWEAFLRGLPIDWPLRAPIMLYAVDAELSPPPTWWQHPPGQWGCRESHLSAIELTLHAELGSVLILEDDAEFCENFASRLHAFLAHVPSDWELLYLGGQTLANSATPVNDHVVTPGYTILAHAYALRGRGLTLAYQWGHEHTPAQAEWDHRLAALSASGQIRAYAPREWLAYQRAGYSDIRGVDRPRRGIAPPIAADQREEVPHE